MAVSNANIWLHARVTENTTRTCLPRQVQLAAIKRFLGCALAILMACSALTAVGTLKATVYLSHFNH